MANHIKTGQNGENIAQKYLATNGYKVLVCNWRYSRAELDIIAQLDDTLIFVEVKTRKGSNTEAPEIAVNKRKEDLLRSAAVAYMEEVGHEWAFRFDIIAITFTSAQTYELKHLEDAFY